MVHFVNLAHEEINKKIKYGNMGVKIMVLISKFKIYKENFKNINVGLENPILMFFFQIFPILFPFINFIRVVLRLCCVYNKNYFTEILIFVTDSNPHYREKSHRCEEGGAITPSKDESRGKILCFRVQVHVRPRTNLAIWLGDKIKVKQPQYK